MIVYVCDAGTGSRVPGSVREHECQGCAVDAASVGGFGGYVCLAAFTSEGLLHQAETYLNAEAKVREGRYILAREGASVVSE